MSAERVLVRVLGNKYVAKILSYALLPVLWLGLWIAWKPLRLMSVPIFADMNYRKKRRLLSEKSARKLLAMANTVQTDFLKENAVHAAHAVIGLHQLNRNEIEAAAASLLESSNTVGSPQLNTFGPSVISLDLANGMLRTGQRDTVLQFLRNVRLFWHIEYAQKKIDEWTDAIIDGHDPELRRWW